LWGDDISIQDKESWLDAIKGSEHLKQSGAWYELCYSEDDCEKFQGAHWTEKLKDEKFHARVLEIMDEEIIHKFDDRTGNAEDFYEKEEK
jgi:hypothetical protein